MPNTVPALAAAVAAGHECVEVDVSRSKDGHLVALHARELRRLTDNRHANVGELTLEEILNLPVPGGGYSVATFAEAMATVMRRGLKQITVDFKEDDAGQGDSFRRDVAAEAFGVAPRSSVAGTRGFGQAVLSAIAAVDETGMGWCLEQASSGGRATTSCWRFCAKTRRRAWGSRWPTSRARSATPAWTRSTRSSAS